MNKHQMFGITDEEVAKRAYSKYRIRQLNGIEGTADEDWAVAEQELIQELVEFNPFIKELYTPPTE